jgi:hypothetical protein
MGRQHRLLYLQCVLFWPHFEPGSLKHASGAATSRGYWTGSFCAIEHSVHMKISIFSTFSTDLVLLALMLVGILRRGDVRRIGGILSLLYTQASPYHPIAATLIL